MPTGGLDGFFLVRGCMTSLQSILMVVLRSMQTAQPGAPRWKFDGARRGCVVLMGAQKCKECGEHGATLGCCVPSCKDSFHQPCAVRLCVRMYVLVQMMQSGARIPASTACTRIKISCNVVAPKEWLRRQATGSVAGRLSYWGTIVYLYTCIQIDVVSSTLFTLHLQSMNCTCGCPGAPCCYGICCFFLKFTMPVDDFYHRGRCGLTIECRVLRRWRWDATCNGAAS